MACEQEKKAYDDALVGWVSDWDDYQDANTNLLNANEDFWQAEGQTWAAVALAALSGSALALAAGWLTYGQIEGAETKFQRAREIYDREYRDLNEGYDELRQAARAYCRCAAPGEEEEEE